jgi:hypothetical protein
MGQTPPLSELMEFPCDYLFKAFGPAAAEDGFERAVHRAVCSIVPVPLDAVRPRTSSGGQYLCVTVLVRVHAFAQIEAIYAALRQVENLKFLL